MSQFSSRIWREFPQRYRFEASKFKKSGKTYFPPRDIEPETGDTEQETVRLPDTGKVATYTVIRVGPSDFTDEVPYALAVVEVEGGVRLMAQLVDVPLENIETGLPVRLEFRKIYQEGEAGIICYGHKAVPA